jgi:hypothetical protein
MLRRARLGMALIGLAVGTVPSHALDNLDKNKGAQELFETNCTICHRGARGLGASMRSWTLSGFLAEHYTTSKATADRLANYLMAVGKRGREAQPQPRRRSSRPSN